MPREEKYVFVKLQRKRNERWSVEPFFPRLNY